MTSLIDPKSVLDATGGLPPDAFILQDETTSTGLYESGEVLMDVDFDTTGQMDSEIYGTFAHLGGSKSQFPDDNWEAFLNDTAEFHFDDPTRLHEEPSSQPAGEEPGSTKQRFPQRVKSILDEFFTREPYPSKIDTKYLAEETGLSIKQVKTWFTNKRSRTELPSLPLSVSNVKMIPEADRVNVTTVLAPSVMAIPTRGSSRSSRLMRSSLERLEKEIADTCQISETRAYSLYALHRYFEDALDFEEIVMKYAAGTMKGSSPIQRENEAVAAVTSDNYVAKCPLAPLEPPSKNRVEEGSTRCDDSSVASNSRSPVRPTKRRKAERFYCTDFPPCQRGFTSAVEFSWYIWMYQMKIDGIHDEVEEVMRFQVLSDTTPSISPTGGSDIHSVAGSLGSVGSARSATSYTSVCSTSSRRGRRRWRQSFNMSDPNVDSVTPQKPTSGRDFRCTFCGERFSRRYEWNRHEESVHVPQTCWICARPECADKPDNERSFFRKDHLIQHLRRTHKLLLSDIKSLPSLDEWKSSTPPLDPFDQALHCGFCGHRSTRWSERVEHIANHVKNGADWNTWAKDRSPLWERVAFSPTSPMSLKEPNLSSSSVSATSSSRLFTPRRPSSFPFSA